MSESSPLPPDPNQTPSSEAPRRTPPTAEWSGAPSPVPPHAAAVHGTSPDVTATGDPGPPIGWPLLFTLLPVSIIAVLPFLLFVLAPAAPQSSQGDDDTLTSIIEVQGRVFVALLDLGRAATAPAAPAGSTSPQPSVNQMADALTPYAATATSAAAVAAMVAGAPGAGPDEAATAIRLLDDTRARVAVAGASLTPDEQRLFRLVTDAIDPAVPLSPVEEDELSTRLGWPGDLLLTRNLTPTHPDRAEVINAARRTMVVIFAGALLILLAFVTGTVLFVIAIAQRRIHARPLWRRLPGPRAADWLAGFAVYIWAFLLLSLIGLAVGGRLGPVEFAIPVVAAAGGLLFAMRRGRIPWSLARRDLGLYRGTGFLREIGAGVVGYMLILPLMAFGVIGTMIVSAVVAAMDQLLRGSAPAGSQELPSHPIIGLFTGSAFSTQLAILFFAAVLIPFIEELMFRGLLFGALRTRARFVASALGTAFIFALLHPQGLVAVPMLASLAFGFALLREWRGSLIAPITAHAIQNGGLLTLWLLAMQ